MLASFYEKVKKLILDNRSDFYIAAVIFLVGLASFGLGRLTLLWPRKEPLNIIQNANKTGKPMPNSAFSIHNSALGKYVASVSGSAYHLPWCPGAQKIKEENKIWFETKEEAESSGYKPAGNCEGL